MTDTPEDRSDEAHLSAEQLGPRSSSRLPPSHEHAGWAHHHPRSPRPGAQEAVGLTPDTLTTLTRRADFLSANRSRRIATPAFVLQVRPRDDGDLAKRVGFTVTKKIGNAVVRNRCKRRLRALAREVLSALGRPGADHVLIGRSECPTRDYVIMRGELEGACRSLNR